MRSSTATSTPRASPTSREREALLTAIQAWVGYDFARDELDDALYRLMRMPEWITSFDGSRASHARLKNLTSDLIGRFARAATAATRERYDAPCSPATAATWSCRGSSRPRWRC